MRLISNGSIKIKITYSFDRPKDTSRYNYNVQAISVSFFRSFKWLVGASHFAANENMTREFILIISREFIRQWVASNDKWFVFGWMENDERLDGRRF